MHIQNSYHYSRHVLEKCCSLLQESQKIMCPLQIQIEMCYIIKIIFYFKFIFIVLPFLNFILSLNYVCVKFYKGHNTWKAICLFGFQPIFLTSIKEYTSFEIFVIEPLHDGHPKSSTSIWVRPICATNYSHNLCEKARSHTSYG